MSKKNHRVYILIYQTGQKSGKMRYCSLIDGKNNINDLSIEQKTPMSEDNKKFSYSEPNCIHTLEQVYSFFLKNLFL
jgi:hypothetical protein